MGSIHDDDSGDESPMATESEPEAAKSSEEWTYRSGEGEWQAKARGLKDRMSHLRHSRDMSDLDVLACDENWWFGDTVKDFTAHKFVLGGASPVLHKILFELDEEANPDRRLLLDKRLGVSLTLVQCYDHVRLDIDGIPPIACEALLDYVYNDKFDEADYENGYSRNLLWRLWHASRAFEMEHLNELCSQTIHATMCEDTVFWDLNYAMQFKDLGTSEVMTKVLKLTDAMHEKLYENPNFVWLDQLAVQELLQRRKPGSCDPMVVYNNLLRWVLYQLDRTACAEIDSLSGADIPIVHRLAWLTSCQAGQHAHVTSADLAKYLRRGLGRMPWTELSQRDFLQHVAPYKVMETEEDLLKESLKLMETVVQTPGRLKNSAFHEAVEAAVAARRSASVSAISASNPCSPCSQRRTNVSRTNSLRKSVKDVKLRNVAREKKEGDAGVGGCRPHSMVA